MVSSAVRDHARIGFWLLNDGLMAQACHRAFVRALRRTALASKILERASGYCPFVQGEVVGLCKRA